MRIFEKGKTKALTLGGVAVCVLIIILLLSAIMGSADKDGYTIYIKDKQLFYASASDMEPRQLTEKFASSGDEGNKTLSEVSYLLGLYIKVSADGEKIFYIDEMGGEDGISLYYRTVDGKNKPKKIAVGIQSFEVSETGETVTYLKSQNGELYQHNLKTEEKIAVGVEKFFVSDDGKNIVYQNNSGDVYAQKPGKSKEKIVSQATSVPSVSEDLKTVYYLKENVLYKQEQGKDNVEIATDVKTVINAYDSGEIYYLKEESAAKNLMDYVKDDTKEKDAKITEPELLISPFMWEYETEEEYLKAYEEFEKEYEEYKKVRDEYDAKAWRDVLREELKQKSVGSSTYKLCHYNGKKETVITEHATGWKTYAQEKEAVIYSAIEDAGIKKVKLSEVTSVAEVEKKVKEALDSASGFYLSVGTKTSEIEQEKARDFDIDAAAKTIYMIDKVSDNGEAGDLYKIKVSGKKAGKSKKIDEEVYLYNASFKEDYYLYYKDVKQGGDLGDLYVDGKCIDFNVRIGTVNYQKGTIAYVTEWSADSKRGILRIYNGKKANTIYGEVYDYVFLPNGDIVYLSDYDPEKYIGNLYIYSGKKSKKVDSDVVALVRMNYN